MLSLLIFYQGISYVEFGCFNAVILNVFAALSPPLQNSDTVTPPVSSEVEMNRTWTDNIILFQTLQLYTRLYIKHQIRFNKLD